MPWISHAEEEGRLEELRGSARAGKVASGKIVLALRGAECRQCQARDHASWEGCIWSAGTGGRGGFLVAGGEIFVFSSVFARGGVLEYSESSCELDTWQERLGYERATHRASEGNFYCWQCTENLYIVVFYITNTNAFVLRVHCNTWVGFTSRNVSETCVQLNTNASHNPAELLRIHAELLVIVSPAEGRSLGQGGLILITLLPRILFAISHALALSLRRDLSLGHSICSGR